jgi:hypothetical protein
MKRITKKLRTEFVKSKLATSPAWALRALQVVYSNQTSDEKMFGVTSEHNNIGFTGTDGEFMSSLAKQYKQRGSLSPKQMGFVMTKMKKYHKQVLSVMDDNKLIDCMNKDGVLSEEDVEHHKGLMFLNMV